MSNVGFKPLTAEDRKQQVRDLFGDGAKATVAQIAELLHVSARTVYRDLDGLTDGKRDPSKGGRPKKPKTDPKPAKPAKPEPKPTPVTEPVGLPTAQDFEAVNEKLAAVEDTEADDEAEAVDYPLILEALEVAKVAIIKAADMVPDGIDMVKEPAVILDAEQAAWEVASLASSLREKLNGSK